jgi:hypothetical protein
MYRPLLGISLIILVLHVFFIAAQDPQDFESILESIEDEEDQNSIWLEYLWDLIENPLNLNTVSSEELHRIPFLTQRLITNLLEFRGKNGPLQNIQDLNKIDGFHQELIDALTPFLTIKVIKSRNEFFYQLQTRLENPKRTGYLKGRYHNPLYLRQKFYLDYRGRILGGVITEKDAGEKDYLDYLSYHIQYKSAAERFTITLGDYQLKVGSGLTYWSAFSIPVSVDALPFQAKISPVIHANRSSSEMGGLRGAAIKYQLMPDISITAFYSRKYHDAILSNDGTTIKNIYTSGLHRTDSESNKKNNLGESIFGGSIQTNLKNHQLQLSVFSQQFDFPFQNYGRNHFHLSFCFMASFNRIQTTGEFAFYQGKIPAIQQSLYFISKHMKYQIIGYYYDPQFFTLHGKTLGSFYLSPANRLGIYFLGKYKIWKSISSGAYCHIYREIYNNTLIPYVNRNFYTKISYKYQKNIIEIQYRRSYREGEKTSPRQFDQIISALRFEQSSTILRKFLFRNRCDLKWLEPLEKNSKTCSLNIFHHLEWKFLRRCKISFRWSNFNVQNYDLRIYEYEPDLPGSYRSVLLYNNGYKFFILIHLQIRDKIIVDIKYQQRFYPTLNSVGSGLDSINHPRIHDIRISFTWKH